MRETTSERGEIRVRGSETMREIERRGERGNERNNGLSGSQRQHACVREKQ